MVLKVEIQSLQSSTFLSHHFTCSLFHILWLATLAQQTALSNVSQIYSFSGFLKHVCVCVCVCYFLLLYEPGHFMESISWKHSKLKLIWYFSFFQKHKDEFRNCPESPSLLHFYSYMDSFIYIITICKKPIIHKIAKCA